MTKIDLGRTVMLLLATLLAAMVMTPVAGSQTVETNSFPGTAGAIAFVSTRDGIANFNIYRMNADGFGQTRLTDTPGVNFSPSWSADGLKIAFVNAPDLGDQSDVWSMNADGSNATKLVQDPGDDSGPAYSPTSNKFAFVSARNGDGVDIYLMTKGPDGQTTSLTRITTSPASDSHPAISPDGRRLAFVSDRDGDEDVYVMRLAPEGPKNVPVKLTKNTRPNPNGPPYATDTQPDWSPDGTQIAFASDRVGALEVYRMKASPEGRLNKPVNLSSNPTAYDEDPTWSPDGKKVAFTTDRDGNSEIYRMRATDGANQVNLTNNPRSDFLPAWQPLP
jgi:Tol biopolymer transport system component